MAPQKDSNAKPRNRPLLRPMDVVGFAALPMELLLHKPQSFGVRSVGPRAGGAVVLTLLFLAFHPNDDCVPLALFLIAIIASSILAHVSAIVRLRNGESIHSRYNGRPYLLRLLPFSEMTVKRLEAPLALIMSCFFCAVNRPLGEYLIISAGALAIITGGNYMADRTRALDLNDSVIEQKIAAEKVRNTLR
jgi:hypothetical protein